MTGHNVKIDIHADDYALSDNSDNDILKLCQNGNLDSISIIPNLDVFEQSVNKFSALRKEFPKEIQISVHLNLMEGKSLINKEFVPHLVNQDGFFTVTWGKLLLWNYNPFLRKKVKQEIKKEITAQIERCIKCNIIDKEQIRLDSHQHPHMIPIFFEALIDSIIENNYKVAFIRNSYDPIFPYVLTKNVNPSAANLIKCCILDFYAMRIRRFLKKRKLSDQILCGVALSGLMDSRILLVADELLSECKGAKTLEILFHPGTMLEKELSPEFTKSGFNKFHISKNRGIEFLTCEELKKKAVTWKEKMEADQKSGKAN